MKYARVGRGKMKHLFAEGDKHDKNGNLLPHEFLGGEETRCGKIVTGVWNEETAMGLDHCDLCYQARGLDSRARVRRSNFLHDNPDAASRYGRH